MKFLYIPEFQSVTNALNFSTQSYHIIGSCDCYTTKAAGSDKKLYKNIESGLETEHQQLVRLSASLSPPRRTDSDVPDSEGKRSGRNRRGRSVGLGEINLSRASPFGSLSSISARRTFAYLVATLNATHVDYEFSNTLKPHDFRREYPLYNLQQTIDRNMLQLRPPRRNYGDGTYPGPFSGLSICDPSVNGNGNDMWGRKMWNIIDKEMDLKACELYSLDTDREDPFRGDESSLWSRHYFFFNKDKKRVCYLYFRAFSILAHSPAAVPVALPRRIRLGKRKTSAVSVDEGASKRAGYWLGANTLANGIDTTEFVDDDDDEDDNALPRLDEEESEVDVAGMTLDEQRNEIENEPYYNEDDLMIDDEDTDAFLDEGWKPSSYGYEEHGLDGMNVYMEL